MSIAEKNYKNTSTSLGIKMKTKKPSHGVGCDDLHDLWEYLLHTDMLRAKFDMTYMVTNSASTNDASPIETRRTLAL